MGRTQLHCDECSAGGPVDLVAGVGYNDDRREIHATRHQAALGDALAMAAVLGRRRSRPPCGVTSPCARVLFPAPAQDRLRDPRFESEPRRTRARRRRQIKGRGRQDSYCFSGEPAGQYRVFEGGLGT